MCKVFYHFISLPFVFASALRLSVWKSEGGREIEARRGEAMMGDEKSSSPMGNRERDRELLIPVADHDSDSRASSSSACPNHHHHHHRHSHTGREVAHLHRSLRSCRSSIRFYAFLFRFRFTLFPLISFWFCGNRRSLSPL